MTTAADLATAWSAITTCQSDLVVQVAATANAAKASQLTGAEEALRVAKSYVQDAQALSVGF
jgi:hypothetical protein